MSKSALTILGPIVLAALAGCTKAAHPTPSVGLANPASLYCAEQGGTSTIRNEDGGQVGYCRLPSGTLIEEWAHYRAAHPAPRN